MLSSSSSKQTIHLVHNSSLSISTLIMNMVRVVDTGNYTCQPSNTKTTSTIHLQVVEKEWGEELLMGTADTRGCGWIWILVYISVVCNLEWLK